MDAPAALSPEMNPGTHWIGSLGLRVFLDVLGKKQPLSPALNKTTRLSTLCSSPSYKKRCADQRRQWWDAWWRISRVCRVVSHFDDQCWPRQQHGCRLIKISMVCRICIVWFAELLSIRKWNVHVKAPVQCKFITERSPPTRWLHDTLTKKMHEAELQCWLSQGTVYVSRHIYFYYCPIL
jgi:hypothetical protein